MLKINMLCKSLLVALSFISLLKTTQAKLKNSSDLPMHFTGKLVSQTNELKKEGSGVVFVYSNDVFVLSSEHVAIASKNQSQFLIQGLSFKINLISSDWISGLSLFKLNDNTNNFLKKLQIHKKQLLSLNNFQLPKKITQKALFNLFVSGFNHQESQANVLAITSTIKYNNIDQVFLSEKPMLELMASVKKGMSGGGTFYKNKNQWNFLGLNSNTYTKDNNNYLLLISSTDIKKWVKDTLNNYLEKNNIVDKKNFREVSISGLNFSSQITTSSSLAISGTDPIGIGGKLDSKNSTKKTPISVTLNLEKYSELFDARLSKKVTRRLYAFQQKKLSNYYIKISYFSYNNQLYYISSLKQFFKYLSLDYKPIIEINSKFDGLFFQKKQEKRKKIAQNIKILTKNLTDKQVKIQANAKFLSYLENMAEKINSKEWFLLSLKEVVAILDSPAWNTIYSNQQTFDIGLNLNAAIENYRAVLPYLIME